MLAFAFPMEKLVLERVPIPIVLLDNLHRQLLIIHHLFGNVTSGKEAKRLQFISPILIAVCQLLPSVRISVEEDMKGTYVHANGRFEFVLQYGKMKVCIVEAKKDDMEHGQVQSLLGCEVVAEIEKKLTVYAIVTNYIEWMFYKNTDDRVYSCLQTLLLQDVPTKDSVGEVASLIYGMFKEIELDSTGGLADAQAGEQSQVGPQDNQG